MARIKDLFEAFRDNELPMDGGYILSDFYDEHTSYTRYEVISYSNVKDIYMTEEGITFQADGRKIFVLVEPVNYSQRHIEPCYRDDAHRVPYRFKEMELYTSKRQDKIMIAKEPIETYTAFTVLNETGLNNSYLCYAEDDLVDTIEKFFFSALWKNSNVPRSDSKKASELLRPVTEKLIIPTGLI